MVGVVEALYRYPVKGFSPEAVEEAELTTNAFFPCDRMFAVENGPSGFDASAPKHISKQKFTVLARAADIAKLKTRYDEASGFFDATLDGEHHRFLLRSGEGRAAFAAFLSDKFGAQFSGQLKVLEGPGTHRFTDHPSGQVSLLNLASVATLEVMAGRAVDPLRFRMNIHMSGLEAFAEDAWQPGDTLRLGEAELTFLAPTVRCKATHAHPQNGEYDFDLLPALFQAFKRNTMGVYLTVAKGGIVRLGDTLERVS